ATEPDDLGRAAANVEDDDRIGAGRRPRGAAGDGERGLGALVDDLELELGLAPDTLHEVDAVCRRPAGFGGDQPGAGDAAMVHLALADLQRLDGALHRAFAEPAARRKPFAEPHDSREGID